MSVTSTKPLVSILTPVYNGAPYLAECIESVLLQTYSDWEYIIVDNHSTDDTPAIARYFAAQDDRIKIHRNEQTVDLIENHNLCFRLASPASRYCKVVSADDWLFKDCIAALVGAAAAEPTVGVVGSYQLSGGTESSLWEIKWAGLKYPSSVIPGREIARWHLLGRPYVFGTPTSTLYRMDLVKSVHDFFPGHTLNADTLAIYRSMLSSDFAFVHQVLSVERVHLKAASTLLRERHSYLPGLLCENMLFGPHFLSSDELSVRREALLDSYYTHLARRWLEHQDAEFWSWHERFLEDLGVALERRRLFRGVVSVLIRTSLNPYRALSALKREGRVVWE